MYIDGRHEAELSLCMRGSGNNRPVELKIGIETMLMMLAVVVMVVVMVMVMGMVMGMGMVLIK